MPKSEYTPKDFHLGIYFGNDDLDLVKWKTTCQKDTGIPPSTVAKDAIREHLVREQEHREDAVLLKQLVKILRRQGELIQDILSIVKAGPVAITATLEDLNTSTPQQSQQQTDFVADCRDLGWGM